MCILQNNKVINVIINFNIIPTAKDIAFVAISISNNIISIIIIMPPIFKASSVFLKEKHF